MTPVRIVRILGSVALWLGALLGIAAGGIWLGGQLGYLQPMIVISGSMEPGIMTGDLLLDRWIPTDQVEVGDILSLNSEATGKPVTHRVISITPLEGERAENLGIDLGQGPRWEVRMQGDANAEPDIEAYYPGDSVLTPFVDIPAVGTIVSKLMEPAVAIPILLALLALFGLSLLDEQPRRVVQHVIGRVRHRDTRVDELDVELAAVGVDVLRLQEMNDLDLHLYALGVDVDTFLAPTAGDGATSRDDAGMLDFPSDRSDDTEPIRRRDDRPAPFGHDEPGQSTAAPERLPAGTA